MLACVKALLRHGSDVNHKNMDGFSPLHVAVQSCKLFSMEMLRELVTNGYNTDVNIPESLSLCTFSYDFHNYQKCNSSLEIKGKIRKTYLEVLTYFISFEYQY